MNIRQTVLASAIALTTLGACASAADAAVIVNLDGVTNTSFTGTTAAHFLLGAGTYSITPIIDKYTAFTRFSNVLSCDVNGEECYTGYEHSYKVTIGATTYSFGDRGAGGGLNDAPGTVPTDKSYYDTALHAFNEASPVLNAFTLAAPTDVAFWILDGNDQLSDNSGGISLSVSAVPEPATWAMLLLGFFGVGFAVRGARRKGAALTA